MILAKVTGTVVSTRKNEALVGYRLLLVHPLDLDGRLSGCSFIAIDTVDAGVGDRVLVTDDGGSARIVVKNDRMPLRHVVVGVVDDVQIETRA